MEENDVTLSVIIPTYDRPEHLRRCLQSILKNDLGSVREILVIVNDAGPLAREVVSDVNGHDPRLQVIEIPKSSRGRSRNMGLSKASGRFCYFLDDDVVLPPDTLKNLKGKLESYPSLGILGGPNKTPPDGSLFEICAGFVLGSLFGMWKMRARVKGTEKDEWVDERSLQLCNLCIRKDLLSGDSPFDERLASAEENLLLIRLQKAGHRQMMSPDISVYHRRRKNWGGFCLQIFYGAAGRFQMAWLRPSSFSPVFFVPTAFLIYILSLPFWHSPSALIPLAAYGALLFGESVRFYAENKDLKGALCVLILFPSCHLSYGLGFLLGGIFWR